MKIPWDKIKGFKRRIGLYASIIAALNLPVIDSADPYLLAIAILFGAKDGAEFIQERGEKKRGSTQESD